VLRAAEPLAVGDRDAFLQDVAAALQGQELRDERCTGRSRRCSGDTTIRRPWRPVRGGDTSPRMAAGGDRCAFRGAGPYGAFWRLSTVDPVARPLMETPISIPELLGLAELLELVWCKAAVRVPGFPSFGAGGRPCQRPVAGDPI
jgi:hypothetical protein